ncbi:MAG: hypothetical protein VXW87_00285 [Pseudomonadota bacterium]|nr:hypothetical protein [Pseudomonadota bacterium]
MNIKSLVLILVASFSLALPGSGDYSTQNWKGLFIVSQSEHQAKIHRDKKGIILFGPNWFYFGKSVVLTGRVNNLSFTGSPLILDMTMSPDQLISAIEKANLEILSKQFIYENSED